MVSVTEKEATQSQGLAKAIAEGKGNLEYIVWKGQGKNQLHPKTNCRARCVVTLQISTSNFPIRKRGPWDRGGAPWTCTEKESCVAHGWNAVAMNRHQARLLLWGLWPTEHPTCCPCASTLCWGRGNTSGGQVPAKDWAQRGTKAGLFPQNTGLFKRSTSTSQSYLELF